MIADLKPYPAYKDSGVEWLGDVPEHWQMVPNRAMMRLKKELVGSKSAEYLLLSLTKRGVVARDMENPEGKFPAQFDSYQVIEPGDLIFCLFDIDETPRAVGLSSLHGMITGAYTRVVCADETARRFVYLLYMALDNGKHLKPLYTGLRKVITKSTFLSAKMPLPSPPEQTAIVRYLDHADRRIRRYIHAKQKLVKLLEEQKQALIHQSVTGRIDVRTGQPYPAYKDSGVEWLGEVPQGWQRCRLRNIVSMVTTGSRGWASYASDTGPLFIRVANLSRGSLRLRFDDLVRLDLPITSEAGRTRIEAGDLLLSVTAYIGSVGVAPEGFEEAYVSQHVARCRPLPGMHARWLGYVLLSTVGQTHGQMSLYGGTKDGLSLDDVKNYPILLPPQHEQEPAVRWIEGGLSGLVKIGDGAKRQIELVREYRTRLVADVVTGKLDVREAAARLPEVDPHADEFDAPIQAAETGVMEVEDTESREELAMKNEATV